MRRVGSWGMTAALIVGLGGAVVFAGGPDNDVKPAPKGWLSGLFTDKPKPPAKVDKKPVETPPEMTPPSVELAAVERQRQENAMLRRMEVCDRLRAIALQSNNEALMHQAEELLMRAEELYRQKTAGLPMQMGAVASATKPPRRDKMPREGSGMSLKDLNGGGARPQPQPNVFDTPARLGGNFAEREQAAINGTGMGGNRP